VESDPESLPRFFIPFCEEKSKAGKKGNTRVRGGESAGSRGGRGRGAGGEEKKKQRETARDKETRG